MVKSVKKDRDRITVRLTPTSRLRIDELKKVLNVSYSQLLRTIIDDFCIKNESTINDIIDKKR